MDFKPEKKLGFGLMRLPLTDPSDDASVDVEQVCKMVDTFLEKGFNGKGIIHVIFNYTLIMVCLIIYKRRHAAVDALIRKGGFQPVIIFSFMYHIHLQIIVIKGLHKVSHLHQVGIIGVEDRKFPVGPG